MSLPVLSGHACVSLWTFSHSKDLDPEVMTNIIDCFITFLAKVFSILHPKLKLEAFLRTKGQAPGGTKKTLVKAAGEAKEL